MALAGWRIDWEMAFKQSPIKPQIAKWMQEVFWNPEVNRIQRLIPRGSCFGGKAAQYNFVHEVHFVVHVARVVFGILAAHYSNDMWAIEPICSATSSWQCMCTIMDTMGWRYDKRKSPPPTSDFKLLGVIFTLDIEVPFIRLPADRVDRLLHELERYLRKDSLSTGEASSLRGRWDGRGALCGEGLEQRLSGRSRHAKIAMVANG